MRSKLRRCEKLALEHNIFVKPKVNRVAAILDKISDDMNRIMDYSGGGLKNCRTAQELNLQGIP